MSTRVISYPLIVHGLEDVVEATCSSSTQVRIAVETELFLRG
jgi:hypothetical protein